jgi:hypothetical protein
LKTDVLLLCVPSLSWQTTIVFRKRKNNSNNQSRFLGQVWVDPTTKRMTWFAWAGAAYLQTTVRDLFYDAALQDLLMYPVPEMKTLRGKTPLGELSDKTINSSGSGSPVALFTAGPNNTTTFDVEATVALPPSGAAVEFNVLLLASPAVRKRISFAMPFYTKNAIILPRQARDKHRESTHQKMRFCRTTRRTSRTARWST